LKRLFVLLAFALGCASLQAQNVEVTGANQWQLCDVVAGIATCSTPATLSTAPGLYTVQIVGTYSALFSPNGYLTANFSTNNISGGAGLNSTYAGAPASLATVTSFKIMSVVN
jgi:hypothetical protein